MAEGFIHAADSAWRLPSSCCRICSLMMKLGSTRLSPGPELLVLHSDVMGQAQLHHGVSSREHISAVHPHCCTRPGVSMLSMYQARARNGGDANAQVQGRHSHDHWTSISTAAMQPPLAVDRVRTGELALAIDLHSDGLGSILEPAAQTPISSIFIFSMRSAD